jgi:hypothetical protein
MCRRNGGLVLLVLAIGGCDGAKRADGALAAVRALLGTYSGHWDVRGLDANGQPLALISWDDRVEVSNPRIDRDRALVSVRDRQELPAPAGEMVVDFLEGFHIRPDGSPGARFFEIGGVETIEQPLGADSVAFESAFVEADRFLTQRNPETIVPARSRHYSIKIVERVGAIEREDISRVTRLVWADDTTQTLLSMHGYHERQTN